MPDPVEPSTLEDWKTIAEGQMFLKEQYRQDNLALRRQIYLLRHKTAFWKRILLKFAVGLMKRD